MTEPSVSPASLDAVRQAARTHDNDRYLAALLSPPDVRNDLFALAAFAGEIARIPHLVKEPMIGEIRLQWWRDAVPALARGEATGNPIADALGGAVSRHNLPTGLLLGVVDARAFDLYPDPMPDQQTFKAYLAKSEGALFELALRIVAGWPPGTAAAAVSSAGQAVGLTRVLAGLPHMLAMGRLALPQTLLGAAGIGIVDLAAVPIGSVARGVIDAVVHDARVALAVVAGGWNKMPRRPRSALLPVALVEPQLRALQKASHHPARDIAHIMPLSRVWQIWRAHVFGRL